MIDGGNDTLRSKSQGERDQGLFLDLIHASSMDLICKGNLHFLWTYLTKKPTEREEKKMG
jgi:hypothetical protein